MSGWIKVEKDLESDPRVLRMAKDIGRLFFLFHPTDDLDPCNACAFPGVTLVCGALTRLWIYADSHARDDDTLDMGAQEINEWLGIPNFCSIVPKDWLIEIDEHTVELPGYQQHNGTEARKRALTQKRVAQHRKRDSVAPSNASALPDQTKTRPRPRLDQTKTKSKISIPSESLSDAEPPDDVRQVFDHWRQVWNHRSAALDPKRRATIRKALKGYSVADLCESISGYQNSGHHIGQNERNTVYDGLHVLLRDADHIDAGLRFARDPPQLSSKLQQHNVAVLQEWRPQELRDADARLSEISGSDGEIECGIRKRALTGPH